MGVPAKPPGLTQAEHNNNVLFVIPQTDTNTGYLPPGVHTANWCEVVDCFAGNSHRANLTEGLLAACRNLAAAGCRELLLDGSFVTTKTLPGDYDGAWETAGVDPDRVDPVLLDFSQRRAAMKSKYVEILGRPLPGVGICRIGSALPRFLYD